MVRAELGLVLGRTVNSMHREGAGWSHIHIPLVVQGEVAAFFVADLGAVVRKHFCFLKCLPRVRPFYAVKCNSSLGVLKVLAELGLGFSCANKVSPCPHRCTDH
jgi:diaminopimelate decarboxylase